MRSLKYLYVFVAIGLAGVLTIGCAGEGSKAKDNPVGKKSGADDGHSHGHAHVHGPMGGEVENIPGTDMKLECYAKYGQDLVAFDIYESDLKTSKKVKCEKIIGRIAAAPDKEFVIEAVNLEDGMASKFEIQDQDFAIARKSVGIKLEFEIDGKKYTVSFAKDPHG